MGFFLFLNWAAKIANLMKQSPPQCATLILEDGKTFIGEAFGARKSIAGEVVFNTGMVGYPEVLTDPSYRGQILVLTYPLIGNYGVPQMDSRESDSPTNLESRAVQIAGLIVSDYSREYSHWNAHQSLGEWLKQQGVPALMGIDTRSLTQILREKGTMLGKIEFPDQPVGWRNPDVEELVPEVSIKKPQIYENGDKKIVLLDCGAKANILRNLLQRKVTVKCVPYDYDLSKEQFDGLVISNGPGNPKLCRKTILQIREVISRRIPILGICLGHQLLALACGANTYKLKYGHRSQNQPVQEVGTNRCFVTSQNHGFAVDNKTLPPDWEPYFINLNDGTNEGLRHKSGRFMSVQFHPEAMPGPVDTQYLFDEFLELVK